MGLLGRFRQSYPSLGGVTLEWFDQKFTWCFLSKAKMFPCRYSNVRWGHFVVFCFRQSYPFDIGISNWVFGWFPEVIILILPYQMGLPGLFRQSYPIDIGIRSGVKPKKLDPT